MIKGKVKVTQKMCVPVCVCGCVRRRVIERLCTEAFALCVFVLIRAIKLTSPSRLKAHTGEQRSFVWTENGSLQQFDMTEEGSWTTGCFWVFYFCHFCSWNLDWRQERCQGNDECYTDWGSCAISWERLGTFFPSFSSTPLWQRKLINTQVTEKNNSKSDQKELNSNHSPLTGWCQKKEKKKKKPHSAERNAYNQRPGWYFRAPCIN